MYPAALPAAALEHPFYRLKQPQVGIGAQQPGGDKAALLERTQELPSEAFSFTVVQGDAEQLPVAEGIDDDRHHQGPRHHQHVSSESAMVISGIKVVIGKASGGVPPSGVTP
jgi:hypothetical protein